LGGNDYETMYPNFLYDTYDRLVFLLEQQYSDDCSFLCTDTNVLHEVKKETINDLAKRNLKINETKTEEYTIKRNGDDKWRHCKLVGSMLDTKEDIKRRKQLANNAFSKYKLTLLTSKLLSTNVKLRIFNCYIESIFFYNSELWGLTSTQENEIDILQRKLLRNILGIRYSANNWISNDELYEKTNQLRWSQTIRKRRISFFGHVCRLEEKTPAQVALKEAERPVKRTRGRAPTTYLATIKKDFYKLNISSLKDAAVIAQNREGYQSICVHG